MKNISEMIRQLTKHISTKLRQRTGQSLIFIDRRDVPEHPEAGHMIGLGLYDACTRRKVSAALVDIDEWIARAVIAEGRFNPEAWPAHGIDDLLTGEPARERALKDDLTWLHRHRSRFTNSALSAGGDAEVVILLHELELVDIFMHVPARASRRMAYMHVAPAAGGHPGFIAVGLSRDLGAPLRFGVNSFDDTKTWDSLLTRLLEPGG
jgi:hypothetical protein